MLNAKEIARHSKVDARTVKKILSAVDSNFQTRLTAQQLTDIADVIAKECASQVSKLHEKAYKRTPNTLGKYLIVFLNEDNITLSEIVCAYNHFEAIGLIKTKYFNQKLKSIEISKLAAK